MNTNNYHLRLIDDVMELRERQMKILDFIHAFCTANDIHYSISSGTLLGAIRHGGYIPWDDDIDIYMPRDSYNRFVSSFQSDSGQYRLLSHDVDPKYIHSFVKVIDIHTVVKEECLDIEENGLWIDVFPVDYVSDSKSLRTVQNSIRKYLFGIIRSRQKNSQKLHLKDFIYRFTPIPTNCAFKILQKVISAVRQSGRMMNLSDGGPVDIEKNFPAVCLSSFIDIRFENRLYKSMVGYDVYLSQTYGNYMQLPPENQRVHHMFVAYEKIID